MRSLCCARTATGHAAALPSSVINSRRFIAADATKPEADGGITNWL
jgi:hypothetical protein